MAIAEARHAECSPVLSAVHDRQLHFESDKTDGRYDSEGQCVEEIVRDYAMRGLDIGTSAISRGVGDRSRSSGRCANHVAVDALDRAGAFQFPNQQIR